MGRSDGTLPRPHPRNGAQIYAATMKPITATPPAMKQSKHVIFHLPFFIFAGDRLSIGQQRTIAFAAARHLERASRFGGGGVSQGRPRDHPKSVEMRGTPNRSSGMAVTRGCGPPGTCPSSCPTELAPADPVPAPGSGLQAVRPGAVWGWALHPAAAHPGDARRSLLAIFCYHIYRLQSNQWRWQFYSQSTAGAH
jgi:hypothetical protein